MEPDRAPTPRRRRSRRALWIVPIVVVIAVVVAVVIGVSGEQPTATPTPIVVPEPSVTLPASAPSASTAPIPASTIEVKAPTEAAARTAVAAAKSGDVVVFPAGRYAVHALMLTAGVRYVGRPGAVITSSNTNAFHCNDCSGVTIEGFTFDGGNLNLGSDGITSKSVTVVNDVFTNVKSTEFGVGQALLVNHVDGLTVRGNTFTDDGTVEAQNAIIGYDLNSATISGNVLRNVYQGIHMELDQSSGNGIVVTDNWISGLSRMGVEIQGYSAGLTVTGNTVTGWTNTAQGNRIGLSIVTRGTGRSRVTGNIVVGVGITQEPAVEFMGSASTIEDNVLYGFGSGVSVSCAKQTTFAGNHISAFGKYGAFSRDGGYCGGETIGANIVNGVSVRSKL